ncbi:MAG: LCCL domain-containing protein [Trueperaceae bacterium]|nr:LCCL domain-containing protein [Trueperaceae bacterium]
MTFRRWVILAHVVLVAGLSGALAQPTSRLALGATASGTIDTWSSKHVYFVSVPNGLEALTIEVDGEGRDADLGVYLGDRELHRDTSSDPNPTFTLRDPVAGEYRVEVLNLLFHDLRYTVRAYGDGAGMDRESGSTTAEDGLFGSTRMGAIELGGRRQGTVPASQIDHAYDLYVPADTDRLAIRVDADGVDVDLAVELDGAEIYDDISADPYPTFTQRDPVAGRYTIRVKNLLPRDIPYLLSVDALGPSEAGSTPSDTSTAPATPARPASDTSWVADFADGDVGGWTVENGTLSNPGHDGPDGRGHLYAVTPSDGRTGYFVAPATVSGDWSAVTSVQLTLRIGPKHPDGSRYGAFTSGAAGDVVLTNGAKTAAFVFPNDVTASWSTFDVPLDGDAGWRLGGGARSLAEVVANVTSFKIRAEYLLGTADAGLAEVRLRGGATPATTTATAIGSAVVLDCDQRADEGELASLRPGERATVSCPAGCSSGRTVWGTDVYTDDSSVCRAAVHAGIVDLQQGGTATLTILPGASSYLGTDRHGIRTVPYGSWDRSFSLERAIADEPAVAPPARTRLSVHATTVAAGEPVTVEFTGGPSDAQAWVGLFRVGAEDRAYLDWQYTGGAEADRVALDAPREAGRYEARIFADVGYDRLATSSTFEVTDR